ncbi:MAG: efflux transporter outer membrane subunit [Rubrivivax sp.]|jgi:NodT family efflux transporter outer membrane factor (OMF) lipoprotein
MTPATAPLNSPRPHGGPRALHAATWASLVLLTACATPTPQAPGAAPAGQALPAAWQAPRAASAVAAAPAQAGAPGAWLLQHGDPALPPLVQAAQRASATVAQAGARIEHARAARTAAGAALLPGVNGVATLGRGLADPGGVLATSANAGLQARWELDLFGSVRAGRDGAQARLNGAAADLHAARLAVAAEVASTLVDLRACQAQAQQQQRDADSRAETARITDLAARAGLRAPADAALARASAAQGRTLWWQQQTACEVQLKALVALTALDEPTLRQQLAAGQAQLPTAVPVPLAALPAALLQQRPDLASAAAAVNAAAADVALRDAQRWPQLSLSGSLGRTRISTAAATLDGNTWSLGPLQVTLPLFDGGERAAQQVAARATYDAAVLAYQANLRQAVREVEEALVRLQGVEQRQADVLGAAQQFNQVLQATEARWRGGLASQIELEEVRRSAVAATSAVLELQRERLALGIALYRALGGGWDLAQLGATEAAPTAPPTAATTSTATAAAR